MEEAVWICEEPEAEVSFHGQSLEAIRSSGYAPYQPGLTTFSDFIYYLFISFNQKKKKIPQCPIKSLQKQKYRSYIMITILSMVLKTGTVKEPEKYLIIGFMVGSESDQ